MRFEQSTFGIVSKTLLSPSKKQKSPPSDGDFLTDRRELHVAEAGVYFAENVADDRAEDHESGDHDDGDQNEN